MKVIKSLLNARRAEMMKEMKRTLSVTSRLDRRIDR
jgi:hypothetical protein